MKQNLTLILTILTLLTLLNIYCWIYWFLTSPPGRGAKYFDLRACMSCLSVYVHMSLQPARLS